AQGVLQTAHDVEPHGRSSSVRIPDSGRDGPDPRELLSGRRALATADRPRVLAEPRIPNRARVRRRCRPNIPKARFTLRREELRPLFARSLRRAHGTHALLARGVDTARHARPFRAGADQWPRGDLPRFPDWRLALDGSVDAAWDPGTSGAG